MLKTALEMASCLVFPKTCETCREILPAKETQGVCASCRSTIRKIRPPFCPVCGRTSVEKSASCGQCRDTGFHFDRAYAAAYYDGKMQELLQSFKFSGRKSLKTFLSGMLTAFIAAHLDLSAVDAVVSVPMDPRKENERGFNQSRLLSAAVSKKIGKEDLSVFLKRKKSGQAQSRLNKNQRRRNITDSFWVKNTRVFTGKRILLIDDILTTGFTASECSKTLKNAGASSVTLLAAARGL